MSEKNAESGAPKTRVLSSWVDQHGVLHQEVVYLEEPQPGDDQHEETYATYEPGKRSGAGAAPIDDPKSDAKAIEQLLVDFFECNTDYQAIDWRPILMTIEMARQVADGNVHPRPKELRLVPAALLRDVFAACPSLNNDEDSGTLSEHQWLRDLAEKYNLDADQLVAICRDEAEWLK